MKINPKLKLRRIAGETIVILPSGGASADMTKVLSLNESSRFLWEKFFGRDFALDDIVAALLKNYEVEEDVARADAAKWLEQLKSFNVIA